MEGVVDDTILAELESINKKLDRIEETLTKTLSKVDVLEELITPVHAHADWVDRVRSYLSKVIPRNRIENA